jgi:hypothetical protein
MSSESKQWLLEIALMVLALIALASAPARGTVSHDTVVDVTRTTAASK